MKILNPENIPLTDELRADIRRVQKLIEIKKMHERTMKEAALNAANKADNIFYKIYKEA